MCLEIYELDSPKKFSAPWSAWQAALKKIKLDLLTDINMLSMVEKGIKGRIATQFFDIQKLITNAWKIMIKIKNCLFFNIAM